MPLRYIVRMSFSFFLALCLCFAPLGFARSKRSKKGSDQKTVRVTTKAQAARLSNIQFLGAIRKARRNRIESYKKRWLMARMVAGILNHHSTVKEYAEKGSKKLRLKKRLVLTGEYEKATPGAIQEGTKVHLFDRNRPSLGVTLSFLEGKNGKTDMRMDGRNINKRKSESVKSWLKRVAKYMPRVKRDPSKRKSRRGRSKSAWWQPLLELLLPTSQADPSSVVEITSFNMGLLLVIEALKDLDGNGNITDENLAKILENAHGLDPQSDSDQRLVKSIWEDYQKIQLRDLAIAYEQYGDRTKSFGDLSEQELKALVGKLNKSQFEMNIADVTKGAKAILEDQKAKGHIRELCVSRVGNELDLSGVMNIPVDASMLREHFGWKESQGLAVPELGDHETSRFVSAFAGPGVDFIITKEPIPESIEHILFNLPGDRPTERYDGPTGIGPEGGGVDASLTILDRVIVHTDQARSHSYPMSDKKRVCPSNNNYAFASLFPTGDETSTPVNVDFEGGRCLSVDEAMKMGRAVAQLHSCHHMRSFAKAGGLGLFGFTDTEDEDAIDLCAKAAGSKVKGPAASRCLVAMLKADASDTSEPQTGAGSLLDVSFAGYGIADDKVESEVDTFMRDNGFDEPDFYQKPLPEGLQLIDTFPKPGSLREWSLEPRMDSRHSLEKLRQKVVGMSDGEEKEQAVKELRAQIRHIQSLVFLEQGTKDSEPQNVMGAFDKGTLEKLKALANFAVYAQPNDNRKYESPLSNTAFNISFDRALELFNSAHGLTAEDNNLVKKADFGCLDGRCERWEVALQRLMKSDSVYFEIDGDERHEALGVRVENANDILSSDEDFPQELLRAKSCAARPALGTNKKLSQVIRESAEKIATLKGAATGPTGADRMMAIVQLHLQVCRAGQLVDGEMLAPEGSMFERALKAK